MHQIPKTGPALTILNFQSALDFTECDGYCRSQQKNIQSTKDIMKYDQKKIMQSATVIAIIAVIASLTIIKKPDSTILLTLILFCLLSFKI